MQVAFNGFHLLTIPLLIYLNREAGIELNRSSVLVVSAGALYPVAAYIFVPVPVSTFLFNIVFVLQIFAILYLASSLLRRKRYVALSAAYLMFCFADSSFLTATMFDPKFLAFSLDPIWFTAHSLISFSMVRYASRGDLP